MSGADLRGPDPFPVPVPHGDRSGSMEAKKGMEGEEAPHEQAVSG